MGISDFGQVGRLISKRFQEGVSSRKDGKRRRKVAESPHRTWISKAEARKEPFEQCAGKESYEMNKCLSLVHLITNLRDKSQNSPRIFGVNGMPLLTW